MSVIEQILENIGLVKETATFNTSVIILAVAVILFSGFLMTRVTKLIKLPNVTAYIITGILIGPSVLKIVPKSFVNGTDFLSDIALAFIPPFITGTAHTTITTASKTDNICFIIFIN